MDDLDSHTGYASEYHVPTKIVGMSNNTEPINTYVRYNSARSDVVTDNPSDNNSSTEATNRTNNVDFFCDKLIDNLNSHTNLAGDDNTQAEELDNDKIEKQINTQIEFYVSDAEVISDNISDNGFKADSIVLLNNIRDNF